MPVVETGFQGDLGRLGRLPIRPLRPERRPPSLVGWGLVEEVARRASAVHCDASGLSSFVNAAVLSEFAKR